MGEDWKRRPLSGYRENAPHLFGYAAGTVSEYLRDLESFLREVGSGAAEDGEADAGGEAGCGRDADDGPEAPEARLLGIRREDVEAWIVRLSQRGLKATTINRKVYALNSFFVWAVHHRLIAVSPMHGIRRLKTPRRLPKFLTFEDVSRLLDFTGALEQTATARGRQVHAMISILYYLGLRRQELVDIRFEHIEKVSESEVYLHVFGKGDKQRMVPFPEPAHQACRRYLQKRPESSSRCVFVSLRSLEPLSRFDVNEVCRRLSQKVELSKKLTPHLLRHTFATHLHLKGQPIEHINALLGHESLNTTKIYVHIDSGRLRESVGTLVSAG